MALLGWPWRPILHRVTARKMRLPLVLVSSSLNAVSMSSLSGPLRTAQIFDAKH